MVEQVRASELEAIHDLAENGHITNQWRFTVYSKNGVADICLEGCESSATQRICSTWSSAAP